MNKERRKRIRKQIEIIEIAKSSLEDILFDEETAFDSMPENLQYSSRGEESQEAIDYLQEAISMLEEAVSDNLECIM